MQRSEHNLINLLARTKYIYELIDEVSFAKDVHSFYQLVSSMRDSRA